MRGKRVLAVGLVVIGLAAAGIYAWRRAGSTSSQALPQEVSAAPPSDVMLPVTVRAREVTPIPAPIEGTIEQYHVEVGDEVFEGQLLAHIKNTAIESEREQASEVLERTQERVNRLESAIIAARLEASRASADAARARGEYDRTERVYQRQQLLNREGATPRLTFEKAEKEYLNAKAEFESLDALAKQVDERVSSMTKDLDNARRGLDEKRQDYEDAAQDAAAADIRSPITGLVVARRGAEGDEVSREVQDLFQIASDLTTLLAVGEPDPKTRPLLKPNQFALLHFAEVPDAVSATVTELREDGTVVLEFANPGPQVKPGSTAQARIRVVE